MIGFLIDIIWLIDILNIKGFEFLDTIFGLNTLFWSVYITLMIFLGIFKGSSRGDR